MLNIFYDRTAAFPFFCPDRNMGKYVLTRKKPMMPRRLSGGRGIFILGRTDGTLGTFRTDGTRMRRNQKDFSPYPSVFLRGAAHSLCLFWIGGSTALRLFATGGTR